MNGIQDENKCCALCVHACEKNGRFRCGKKGREVEEENCCLSFEYDLLKYRPAPFPRFEDCECLGEEP